MAEEDPISENVSEKRRRGRPRTIDREMMALTKGCSTAHTERGKQNTWYMLRAIYVLNYKPAFRWLCPTEKAITAGEEFRSPTILSELGRIDDDGAMRQVAQRICELKPKVREAVAMIRRWRIGRSPAPSAFNLFIALLKTIDAYRETHPDVTWQQVLGALDNAREAIEEEKDKQLSDS